MAAAALRLRDTRDYLIPRMAQTFPNATDICLCVEYPAIGWRRARAHEAAEWRPYVVSRDFVKHLLLGVHVEGGVQDIDGLLMSVLEEVDLTPKDWKRLGPDFDPGNFTLASDYTLVPLFG